MDFGGRLISMRDGVFVFVCPDRFPCDVYLYLVSVPNAFRINPALAKFP